MNCERKQAARFCRIEKIVSDREAQSEAAIVSTESEALLKFQAIDRILKAFEQLELSRITIQHCVRH